MSPKNNPDPGTVGDTVVVTGVINAPVRAVYRAWAEPSQMVQWWGPAETECRSVDADLKVGGAFRIHLASPKGDHVAIGKFTEIVPEKRLQFTFEWENYAMPESLVTVDFEDLGKTTRLTLVHAGLPDQEDAAQHNHGWTSMVGKFTRLMDERKIKE